MFDDKQRALFSILFIKLFEASQNLIYMCICNCYFWIEWNPNWVDHICILRQSFSLFDSDKYNWFFFICDCQKLEAEVVSYLQGLIQFRTQ